MEKYRILLLTNRDSDNIGDQIIEACDISIIKAIMENLGVSEADYEIISREASIVSHAYLQTRNEDLIKSANKVISQSDVVVFGGAPVFNYLYQYMYERTAVTIEIAEKYNKPVIFSAVGVDGYDENNERCNRIKEKINSDMVVQVMTRDNIDALRKYMVRGDIPIGKVSDPAVFSDSVFENFIKEKNIKKKIGLFVFRSHGFEANKIAFSKEDAVDMWLSFAKELENRGYEYEFLTSGHFGDEAFMDHLVRNCGVGINKCVFNINTPEKLIEKISSYDGVISCRLHPSIISYSLGVPSLGILWNNKVKGFYESVGCADRVVYTDNLNINEVVDRLESAMNNKIEKDKEYHMTVYNTLFEGLKKSLKIETDKKPYSYDELIAKMPKYSGTTEKQLDDKIRRKLRRAYKTLNAREDQIRKIKESNNRSIIRRIIRKIRTLGKF